MKKFIIALSLLALVFGLNMPAKATEEPTGVTFIYINGSNNLTYKNREKFKIAFLEDVKNLHPQIKQHFEENDMIKENFLNNGRYVINPEPVTFYWGDRSLEVVKKLDQDLASASKYSPKIAHQARSLFAHCLHDAVWVQQHQNMTKVIDDLHVVVNNEVAKGNRVVLLGYSAGSFVTYQYYLNKANSIPSELIKGQYGAEIDKIIESNPAQPTCFDALVEADLVKFNPRTGKYDPNPDMDVFKKNYANLDKYTSQVCFPGGTVKGVVGFASPVRLFYSDFTKDDTSINNISRLMAKSIIENDVFYLTVNYSNDPFGFSNSENFTLEQIQKDTGIILGRRAYRGFIYNKSNNYVPRTFITAHLAYWSTPKRFAKAIVKAFNEGYPNFYGIDTK